MEVLKKLIIIILCCLIKPSLQAQDLKNYRYDQDLLTKEFHQSRREALRNSMPANSLAIVFSNPIRNYSGDTDYPFHQDPDFYYLTGFTEPNSVLVLFKEKQIIGSDTTLEILFVPDRSPEEESWNGRRAGREGAMELLGIAVVRLTASFDTTALKYQQFESVLFNLPRGLADDKSRRDDLFDLVESFKKRSGYPSDNGDARLLHSLLTTLREDKQNEEMILLRKAIDISCEGQLEMMRATKAGMAEYEVQAVGEYVFKRGGAEAPGFPSICGGGENSTILHYLTNRKKLVDGDLIVLDMGAEYHGYTGDVTRTLPVSGRFTADQKFIYELVLKAQQAGIDACRPGNAFLAPHEAASEVIKKGLLDLEIIHKPGDYRKYFGHGTSHYLGLDAHDAGSYGPLKAGNVITVEPGIYIPDGSPCDPRWWNIGVRIEDDVLITQTGCENLSQKVPRAVQEVEKMMKESPVFVK